MSRFVDTLLAHGAADSPTRSDRGITTGEPTQPCRTTWTDVHRKALRAAGYLISTAAPGVQPGDAVAVLAGDPALIAPAVQGVWLAGGSVTMLHQPTHRADLASWAADTIRVLGMIDAKLVLLGAPFGQLAPVLDQHGIAYLMLVDLDGLAIAPLRTPVLVGEDDTALLQLTSGSSAEPKAVRITHGNLYANITAMAQAGQLDPANDVMVSWLPLFHDMGMIGLFTIPMVLGLELVKVTPMDFMSRPLLWAELISRYHATITASPNFGYAVAARRLATTEEHFDLSSLRFALNGAEPIEPAAVRAFTTAGARFGLPETCMVCAYGMAETTLGVSFAPCGVGMQVDTVDADALETRRQAVAAEPADCNVRAFPRLGPPLPGMEVQVLAEDGRPLREREVGRLQLRGESVTREYLTTAGPVPTQDPDGWLDTGDEGYLTDGDVVVCGRRKDVIIMGGRNIYPVDIERAAGLVPGVRPGNVAAVRIDAGARRESFAVAVESTQAGDAEAERILRKEVISRVVDAIGLRPAAVVVLPPATLPKTPSGKLRRPAVRARIADYLPHSAGSAG